MALPLILLPGMMCDHRLFDPQADLGAFRVPALTGADSIPALARAVLAGAPERFALGGVSMGGIVAMEMVRQAPERIAGVALLDTNHLPETPERKAVRVPQIERARRGGLEEIMRDEMKPLYLADTPRRGAILDLCMEMALDLGPAVFVTQSIALRDRPDQTATLRGLRLPTLILCGREDRLCPVARHKEMQGLVPGSTLAIIEGAGHLPTLEQPAATTAALSRWLQGL